MLDENELLFNELYEKTKDCGRVQFINLLITKERENQDLKKQLNSDDWINSIKETERHYIYLIENENQELKEQLEVGEQQYNDLVEEKEKLQEQLSSNTLQFENQQKEFIEWLQANLEALIMCDREFILTNNKKEIKAYSEILSKYKEIIGGLDEQ